ncbi:unnamed protein product, partial [Rotaria magnacalcarata]
ERPTRIRKPNVRYDPSIYVLASFPKKKKHAIIPKHQVTIDVIDEQNGSIRSSDFVQPVRIIAEGTRTKCQEKASQFSRNTGSEEIDIQPANNDEDEELDDNHIYTTKNFYNNDENEPLPQATNFHSNYNVNEPLPPTTDFHSNHNVNEPSLDFDSIVAYQNVKKATKRMTFDDDDNDQLEEETLNMASGNRHKNNSKKKKDDSSSKQLFIDEHTNNEQHTQENLSNPSNVTDDLSYICEQGDDEDDVPPTQSKPIKKKRKRTPRSKESSSKSSADIEITNVQKELLLFQYKVDNRLKVLEKTFRILKSRKFLKENKNLMNIIDLAAQPVPPPPDPEIVLGVDVSKLIFEFDEHTRFVRQVFRLAGYASNPNAVLSNQQMVTELKDALKKRDKRLDLDEEALEETWQIVKESVRQMKHDNKRNNILKAIRTSKTTITGTSPSQAGENTSSTDSIN